MHVLSSIANGASGSRDLNGVARVIRNGKRATATVVPGRMDTRRSSGIGSKLFTHDELMESVVGRLDICYMQERYARGSWWKEERGRKGRREALVDKDGGVEGDDITSTKDHCEPGYSFTGSLSEPDKKRKKFSKYEKKTRKRTMAELYIIQILQSGDS